MQYQFQSTLPLRGATKIFHCRFHCHFISIHAPLTGSDYQKLQRPKRPTNFNPRSPYGERQVFPGQKVINKEFQSTLPLRGATWMSGLSVLVPYISIHAPLTGSDGIAMVLDVTATISIHAPLTGSDLGDRSRFAISEISIHAPLTGSDLRTAANISLCLYFNPRSPYGERQAKR